MGCGWGMFIWQERFAAFWQAAFWQAPCSLFDGWQSCIKYVNEAAGSMFGGVYLELFGRATHELVAADLTAQVS